MASLKGFVHVCITYNDRSADPTCSCLQWLPTLGNDLYTSPIKRHGILYLRLCNTQTHSHNIDNSRNNVILTALIYHWWHEQSFAFFHDGSAVWCYHSFMGVTDKYIFSSSDIQTLTNLEYVHSGMKNCIWLGWMARGNKKSVDICLWQFTWV